MKLRTKCKEKQKQIKEVLMLSGVKKVGAFAFDAPDSQNRRSRVLACSPYMCSAEKDHNLKNPISCQAVFDFTSPVRTKKTAQTEAKVQQQAYEKMLKAVIQKEKNIIFLNKQYSSTYLSPEVKSPNRLISRTRAGTRIRTIKRRKSYPS